MHINQCTTIGSMHHAYMFVNKMIYMALAFINYVFVFTVYSACVSAKLKVAFDFISFEDAR